MICRSRESSPVQPRLGLFLRRHSSRPPPPPLAPFVPSAPYSHTVCYSPSKGILLFVNFSFFPVVPCLKPAFALFQSDMASGVKVDEVVKLKYDDIKKKKSYRYLVFYIKDEKVIQVEKVGDRNADYQEFLQDLYVGGPDDCR